MLIEKQSSAAAWRNGDALEAGVCRRCFQKTPVGVPDFRKELARFVCAPTDRGDPFLAIDGGEEGIGTDRGISIQRMFQTPYRPDPGFGTLRHGVSAAHCELPLRLTDAISTRGRRL